MNGIVTPRASPGPRRLRLLCRPKGLTYLTLRFLHSLGNGPIGIVPLPSLRWEMKIFLIVRPEIMHPKVFSDIGHDGLVISQE